MATLNEIERQALELAESQRALLAARLLGSLPAILADDDEGIAEAKRRDEEFSRDPDIAISFDELKKSFER